MTYYDECKIFTVQMDYETMGNDFGYVFVIEVFKMACFCYVIGLFSVWKCRGFCFQYFCNLFPLILGSACLLFFI